MEDIISTIQNELNKTNGILKLKPAWVARNFIPPGKRFNLPDSEFNLGDRGAICERWLGSTTRADNRVSVPNEGMSFIALDKGEDITLKDAVGCCGEIIMGKEYSANHKGLGRLAKIFDYGDRLPYHIHQMQQHAKLVGQNSKDEAYYFPEGVNMGRHPETFFGVHPYIAREKRFQLLLPHLVDWKDDGILQHAFAYNQKEGDGFHIPSGVTHAPGSALTIELQEDSDVFAMMQAKVGDTMISKELLFKDVRAVDRQKFGEKVILQMVNWELSGDPEFYKNRHTPPRLIEESVQGKSKEYWIFYNTDKFSGKKLYIPPGEKYITKDNGVYNILVWRGTGLYGGIEVEGGNAEKDELLITHNRAVSEIEIINTGNEELEIFKFFGPEVNKNVPFIS
jgi:hypothetical protein